MKVLARLLLLAMLVASLGLLYGCDDGDDGDNGAPGKSAYELAVDNGFVGTEEEWLASLEGTDGQDAVVVPLESCEVCHGEDAAYEAHAAEAEPVVLAVVDNPCANCHGMDATFHGSVPLAVANCAVCHDGLDDADDAPALYLVIHGIHASEQVMPSGEYVYDDETFKVTYPSYMNNCSVCHTDLAAANDMVVTWDNCMSCHEDMTGFPWEGSSAPFEAYHLDLTSAAVCADCHNGGTAPQYVTNFHNGSQTGRSGVIWDGQDTSVVEGAKVDMQITGVSYVDTTVPADGKPDQMKVTWTAKYSTVTVDPCNAVAAAGKPAFHAAAADSVTGQVAQNFSLLRAYGQGDDWTNNNIGTSPGQPVSTNLSTTNTACTDNVATTTVSLTAEEKATKATKAIVALQGKAQVVLPGITDYNPAVTGNQTIDQVRSKTPTYQFKVGTGAAAVARRAIADTSGCLKCHVGSLYQHGGNRVDNVDMCVLCHNEASSEQNVRLLDGVDASEAYDGQAGQTYGFKSLLHAIHSTGSDVNPDKITMIYRTNGVYVWAAEDTVIPNWPGTGTQTVYGSKPAGTNPAGTSRTHNLYHPTYPRPLDECDACHVAGFDIVPDQDISMATTINAGTVALSSDGTSASNLINGKGDDDTLQGTGAAACTSCHSEQFAKGHAYQNGWDPKVFPNGRQTIIDAK